jgi:hypothetical protein
MVEQGRHAVLDRIYHVQQSAQEDSFLIQGLV